MDVHRRYRARLSRRAQAHRAGCGLFHSHRHASSLYAGRLSAVKEVADHDDGTVTVTLSRANTQFPALLNIPVIENDAGDSAIRAARGCTRMPPTIRASPWRPTIRMPTRRRSRRFYLAEYKSVEEITSAFDNGELDLALSDPSSGTDLTFRPRATSASMATTNLQYIGFNTNSSFS